MNNRNGRRKKQSKHRIARRQTDPFADIFAMRDRMLDHFDRDFFGDDMFRDIDNRMNRGFRNFGFDNLDDDFGNFGNFGSLNNFGNGQGQMICQSYSQSTQIGEDGRPKIVKKVKNKTQTVDNNGNIITEENEMFKDSSKGLKKMKKIKGFGDKKVEVIKESRNGQQYIHRNMENLDEDELDSFNQNWNRQAKKTKMPRMKIQMQAPQQTKYKRIVYNQ